MKNTTLLLSSLFVATAAMADISVSGVTARQRWPWNNLVDIDFTLGGDAGEAYYIDVTATGAGKSLVASSFTTEPIVTTGANRIVWDLGADYPDFKADDFAVTVTATPFSDATPVYLVVDISGGTAAAKWPVRYTTKAPVHTAGVADPCKTTELWLKRVKAGTFTDGNGNGYGTADNMFLKQHTCTLTKDYYLGVFSLTQEQCMNLYGEYLSMFTADYGTRPADSVKPNNLRSPYFDSANPNAEVTNPSVVKNLRGRTGMKFDLPTEWQWAYACQAGTGSTLGGVVKGQYRHSENSQPPSDYEYYGDQGNWSADYGTSYVDAYAPNAWGFYGMLGNVWEYCLNQRTQPDRDAELVDPLGVPNSTYSGYTDGRLRARRGGCWNQKDPQSLYTSSPDPWVSGKCDYIAGARICLTIGE